MCLHWQELGLTGESLCVCMCNWHSNSGALGIVWVWNHIYILDTTKCALWEMVKSSLAEVKFICCLIMDVGL